MFGYVLLLSSVIAVVILVLAIIGIRAVISSSRAASAVVKHGEMVGNHREMARLLDAMLVRHGMESYLTKEHHKRATTLVGDYNS